MLLIKINGRHRFYENLDSIKKVSPSTFTVVRGGWSYTVFGGKAAGGSSREWYVEGFGDKAIWTHSLLASLDLINSA